MSRISGSSISFLISFKRYDFLSHSVQSSLSQDVAESFSIASQLSFFFNDSYIYAAIPIHMPPMYWYRLLQVTNTTLAMILILLEQVI